MMTFHSDGAQYPTRSLAAKHARKAGLVAFECLRFGNGEGAYYEVVHRKGGPMLEYALLWASAKDYVSHVECNEEGFPIIVVTCAPDDVDDDIEDYFVIEPVTPSMLTHGRAKIAKQLKPAPTVAIQPAFTLVPIIGNILPRATVNPITGQILR